MNIFRALMLFLGLTILGTSVSPAQTNAPAADGAKKVYILPVREDIMPPLVYVVRRGVKEAMEANADALVLDMNTDGGRVDVTEEIIGIISKFKGETFTYVNDRAFSAGAFISVATQKIYMAPQSVIGAAAPIMMSPTGGGTEKMPDTFEVKMTSAIRALVRTQAEKNDHNIEVVEAMIDKTKELVIDGEVLNKEGNILTLTDRQAAKEYGDPPRPLLSSGTVESLDALLELIGYADATRVEIQPTGAEKLGTWINKISPLLLIIGIIGLYIEFKTPGFGLPGIVGIVAFAIYFLGGYVAGFSGSVWALVFALGLVLVALELFVFPGTLIAGFAGVVLMLVALVMGMVDMYPGTPGAPTMPTLPDLQSPLQDLAIAVGASVVIALVIARFLPKTRLFHNLVSETASGVSSVAMMETALSSRLGQSGTAVSTLTPGGKAMFDDQLLDVITRGERVEKGRPVRVIGHTGPNLVVEEVT
ncbi:MAG TPA: NfeD family protein [Verrucomicrobiota bacterium]|nr:NfeD family protein [Verrucomicrobiota bacterium]